MALLRQCQANARSEEQRAMDASNAVTKLEADVRILKEQIQRRDRRVLLAEKEAGFLQALVVRF
jgi:mitotic spindle assembly checkpoint protein MAD1